jgi:hypothetical protein
MTFPLYQQYVDILNQRDSGLLLVAAITGAVLAWLWLFRFHYPRLLPALRWGVVLAYLISFAIFALVGVAR